MAKTAYVDILPGLEEQFFTGVRSSDRFVFSRLIKNVYLYSRKKKKGVSARSLLPVVAELWAGLSQATKDAWSAAGANSNMNGWRLFVQDTSARIINDLPGAATPNLLHQSWVGNAHIEAPASEIKIIQIHPRFYWISRKVTGKKAMYEPVQITEDLGLPFTLGLNYKTNLTPAGGENFAKIYARFWYSYQGQNLYEELNINLDYATDWKAVQVVLTNLVSYVVRYDIVIHIKGLTGDLFFDNIRAEHSGQNWARDQFCQDINQGFTRAFYQIPKHWAALILPAGASYDSIYP